MDRLALQPLVSRWWWLLALATVVAGVAGYETVTRAPKTYQASAQILVGPINSVTSLDASGALAGTYADIVTSERVLDATISSTNTNLSATELAKLTSAISNQVTRIVTIRVENQDAVLAARLANALANRLTVLSGEADPASNSVLEAFQAQPEYQRLPARTQERIKLAASRVLRPSPAGRASIIDPARPQNSPIKPVVPLIVLLSALGGLLISGVFVLIRESRRAPPS